MIKKPSLVTRAAVAPDWCLTGATTESWFTLIWSEHGGSRHQPSRSQYLLNQSKNKMALALTCCLNVFYLCMQSSILFTAEIVVDSKNIRSTAGLPWLYAVYARSSLLLRAADPSSGPLPCLYPVWRYSAHCVVTTRHCYMDSPATDLGPIYTIYSIYNIDSIYTIDTIYRSAAISPL